jgi:hypothetical protein
MVRVMNVVFGIGIAILLFLVVLLGINAFYPEPKYEEFCDNRDYPPAPMPAGLEKENTTMPVSYSECYDKFDSAMENYERNIFLIASFIGIIFVIVSLYLLGMINIAAGVAFAGLATIVYGFARGWDGTGEMIRFIVGLIVVAIVIFFGVKINRRLK